jgi:hypothetical protein
MQRCERTGGVRLAIFGALAFGLVFLIAVGAMPERAGAQAGGKKGKARKRDPQAGGPLVFTLKRDFIKKYKDKVTIALDFAVDQMGKLHPPRTDGDLHFSGRSDEVGLPIVAEIMNARFEKKAMAAVKDAQGGAPVKLTGVWRFWGEHAGGGGFTQGETLEAFTESNPNHVFEVHPVTRLNGMDLLPSLKPIVGYPFKDAHQALLHFENVKFQIKPNDEAGTVTMRTGVTGYNHIKMMLELLEAPEKVSDNDDGRFVMCAVRDADGELVARKIRMAFVKDSEPERAVRKLGKGDRMMVIGLPRIDLALVDWRIEHRGDEGDPLTWNLPYEMVVVAMFPPQPE